MALRSALVFADTVFAEVVGAFIPVVAEIPRLIFAEIEVFLREDAAYLSGTLARFYLLARGARAVRRHLSVPGDVADDDLGVEAISLARIIFETNSSNEDTPSRVGASDRRFTLPEIAKAARRWLAPEPLEKLLHELNGEAESEPALGPARATDRERKRAYEKLRSLGKLHR